MKTIVAILFLSLYGLALVKPSIPLIEYHIKLDEYKRNCVNKTDVTLHCDGKCLLMQKLNAFGVDTPISKAPAPVKLNIEDYPLAVIEQECSGLAFPDTQNISVSSYCMDRLIRAHITDVFRPPR